MVIKCSLCVQLYFLVVLQYFVAETENNEHDIIDDDDLFEGDIVGVPRHFRFLNHTNNSKCCTVYVSKNWVRITYMYVFYNASNKSSKLYLICMTKHGYKEISMTCNRLKFFSFKGEIVRVANVIVENMLHLLNPNYRRNNSSSANSATENNAFRWDYGKWPGGLAHYVISNQFLNSEKHIILLAMQEIKKSSCVRFIPRTDEATYIDIRKEFGNCNSRIGYENTGPRKLRLHNRCLEKDDVLHELMHALGFFHEHTRVDRDDYIEVKYSNILINKWKNYEKRIFDNVTNLDAEYDFNSILHYKANADAIDQRLPTLIPKISGVTIESDGLSRLDKIRLNRLYQCHKYIAARKKDQNDVTNENELTLTTIHEEMTSTSIFLAVYGSWSTWSTWTTCSASCGKGTQSKNRLCISPSQSGNDLPCSGDDKELRQCNDHPCEGLWSSWSEYSSCSVKCGSGYRNRQRQCLQINGHSLPCRGEQSETYVCEAGPCNQDGYAEWSNWSSCSGLDVRVRSRPCIDTYICNGESDVQKTRCHQMNEGRSGKNSYAEWSNWSSCSGLGVRVRSRPCIDAYICNGESDVQEKRCF